MKFLYGYDSNNYVDVTDIILEKFVKDNVILIPSGDNERCNIIGYDPYPNILKHILIIDDMNKSHKITHTKQIEFPLDSTSQELTILTTPKLWFDNYGKYITNPVERERQMCLHLLLDYGRFAEEYPERLLAVKFLNENARVLEIGGNIGRNSLMISMILNNPKNLVILECDNTHAEQLEHNLKQNKLYPHIEVAALSEAPLIQRGWETRPHTEMEIPNEWKLVNTITFDALQSKYNIVFDTLVADCEGALYYILKDKPTILENINLIIIENDFWDITHKNFVNDVFRSYGFKVVCQEQGGWGPCYDCFYEVWQKSDK